MIFGLLLEWVLLAFVVFTLFQPELVTYGLAQARGQLRIVWNARPINEVLKDPTVADSVKKKLELVQDIRGFAFDSLGLTLSENYTTFYDQHGQRLMWVVTACDPYALKPQHWHFPVLGDVPYKGFFSAEKAKAEAQRWKSEGLDVNIGGASGWSTLGWFRDPVLSSMLRNDEGDLAELIIHELTHGTLFVKDSVDFNENLASFVGEKGALLFLERKFGTASKEYNTYINNEADDRTVETFMLSSAKRLDSLYTSLEKAQAAPATRATAKKNRFDEIVALAKLLPLHDTGFAERLGKRMHESGNAVFMSYVRYGAKKGNFEDELQQQAGGDLKKYVAYLRKKYPSL